MEQVISCRSVTWDVQPGQQHSRTCIASRRPSAMRTPQHRACAHHVGACRMVGTAAAADSLACSLLRMRVQSAMSSCCLADIHCRHLHR